MVRFEADGRGEGGISVGDSVSKTASSCSSREGVGEAGGLGDDMVPQGSTGWRKEEM